MIYLHRGLLALCPVRGSDEGYVESGRVSWASLGLDLLRESQELFKIRSGYRRLTYQDATNTGQRTDADFNYNPLFTILLPTAMWIVWDVLS